MRKVFEIGKISTHFKKYFYEGLGLQRVMGQLMNRKNEKEFRHLSFLSNMGPKQLTAAFGEHDFTYTGEFRCKCWLLSQDGMIFMVASANGRGTTVECAPAASVKVIGDFLKDVVEKLQKLDDAQVKGSEILLNPPKNFRFFKSLRS